MEFFWATGIALIIDTLIGWPGKLYTLIGHPVTWIGTIISTGEKFFNKGSDRNRFTGGTFLTLALTGLVIILCYLLTRLCLPDNFFGTLALAILIWPWLSVRSLYIHVADVAKPLEAGEIENARKAVSMIVGRKTDSLDEAGISRASIESLAENTSDGIFAPVFWALLFGLPGIAAYKTLNTFDSMIGYRNKRYEYFGKFAAKTDDVINYFPARICSLYFALLSGKPVSVMKSVIKEARQHRSPNAGWPEAAMAYAMHIRLSGPRIYDNSVTDDKWVNGTAPDPLGIDISRCLRFYSLSIVMLIVSIFVPVFILRFI